MEAKAKFRGEIDELKTYFSMDYFKLTVWKWSISGTAGEVS